MKHTRKTNNLSELLHFPTSPDSPMKAFIIYDDFACAAQANTALQRSARNASFNVRCNASFWKRCVKPLAQFLQKVSKVRIMPGGQIKPELLNSSCDSVLPSQQVKAIHLPGKRKAKCGKYR